MINLVLKFYIPAFLITLVIALIFSVIYTFAFLTGKKSRMKGRAARFMHELLILNLLVIPVMSFAVLAIMVVFQALRV
jgi:cytochrome b561